jgi:hypothetical protein
VWTSVHFASSLTVICRPVFATPADVGSNYYEGGSRHLISASSRSLPWRNLSIGLGLSLTFVMAVPIGAAQTKGGQVSAGAARKPPETERALRSKR